MVNWDEIKKEFESTDITLKDLAEKHGIKDSTLRSRKNREKWQRNNATQRGNVAPQRAAKKESKPIVVESEDLTEKQHLFCLYYVKSFNATQSAIKAGYSANTAHVQGPRLLGNVRVAEEIRRIKRDMTQGVFIDAMDVLNKYIKIAFSDINDYLTFGRREIEIDRDKEGNPITTEVNYVQFNESGNVDGSVISEVKQGKDGVSIKLEDKMKALEKLSLYFDLFPDKFKREIEQEKLKIAHEKIIKEGTDQEKDVAAALRGLVDGINSKTD
ncbi:terminase small subunit [Metabacillus idriensis]|uniref:terminase small subunit n=1 Tax=Metabacillus idriensis TaxID=324768 RepID=UPI00174D9E57|nr:terminase small subunit [Metabacillus idriensis]